MATGAFVAERSGHQPERASVRFPDSRRSAIDPAPQQPDFLRFGRAAPGVFARLVHPARGTDKMEHGPTSALGATASVTSRECVRSRARRRRLAGFCFGDVSMKALFLRADHSLADRSSRITAIGLVAAMAVAIGVSSYGAEPESAAKPAATTFRLADGTTIPIEQYGETYETVEWQPPLDPDKAKVIFEIDPGAGVGISSISLDKVHRKIYWIQATANRAAIFRANLDGTAREVLFNGFETPEGKGGGAAARGLVVSPELKKIFWTCVSPSPATPGGAIYEADLSGKSVKAIVTGLHSCHTIVVDPVGKKIYFNDDGRIQRADLDGSGAEDLGGRAGGAFAIDVARQLIYACSSDNIVKEFSFDGKTARTLYECKGASASWSSPVVDGASQLIYFVCQSSVVCAPLNDLYRFETLFHLKPHEGVKFTIDLDSQTMYWAHGGLKLMSAPLPPRWPRVRKTAPPLITSLKQSTVKRGDEITIFGSGFKSCRRLFWIAAPSGKAIETEFRVVDDHLLTAVVPKLDAHCKSVYLALVGDGGTTVTLSADTSPVKKRIVLKRGSDNNEFAYLVKDDAALYESEENLVLILKGGSATTGRRGGNVYLVKNGGTAAVGRPAGVVFHEPHARLTGSSDLITRVPTTAIRPSYVERLLTITK